MGYINKTFNVRITILLTSRTKREVIQNVYYLYKFQFPYSVHSEKTHFLNDSTEFKQHINLNYIW